MGDEIDKSVKEYDDQSIKLTKDIQTYIDKLKDTTWKAGLIYSEDLNNLLLELLKQQQTVSNVRTTKQPNDWIPANPLFEFQRRFNDLKELIDRGETKKPSSWDQLFGNITMNMILVFMIILCIVWIYIRSKTTSNVSFFNIHSKYSI